MRWLVLALACTACGRFGFDTSADAAPDVLLGHDEASTPGYAGAERFQISINNLVCEVRYVWIVEW